MQLLCAPDQFVPVHLRHEEIAEEKVDGARNGAFEDLDRGLRGWDGENPVAAGFEKKGSDGEDGFVIVGTEDRLLGSQCRARFCR